MSICSSFVVCCLEVVLEAEKLKAELSQLGKEIIEISARQMENFCGNILQVSNLICMSTRGENKEREESCLLTLFFQLIMRLILVN
jgi:hypothetical protein